ncbi:Uncharacterised protein [Serratia entomophila]|jgi:hypothetical protein|nr:Uncharacterised protein [Serratia entomophila]CAI1133597.1 Uncharacterised protein [Serratia entomophila]CAI1134946.1 Uncharacterised protein [Serratia entomophila]CAI1138400.1 Uncharacterised protein [Serratia entomophila]CAI1143599.1 Uncharacterised protein [Serratia entomophila]
MFVSVLPIEKIMAAFGSRFKHGNIPGRSSLASIEEPVQGALPHALKLADYSSSR